MHRQKIHIKCSRKDRARADVVDIVSSIIASEHGDKERIMIVVGGPGGTGKSTFSDELADALQEASILNLDDYKTSRSDRESMNIYGPHPKANEMELLLKHFDKLCRGETIQKPVYNRDTGVADSTEDFIPEKYVILDGEVSTYREFEHFIDFSIFIDSDWQTQLNTRISRDLNDRNYDKDKAIATFLHSNIREYEEYGASSKNLADIHIYCESDYRLTLESMSSELFGKYKGLMGGEYSRVGYRGFVLAILTPFTLDGSVDKGAFVDHLQYLYEIGVHRILLGGFSSEFYLLTHSERVELLVAASRYFPGYITYNVTSFSLFESIEHIKLAEEIGADGVMALPPLVPVGIADSTLERYFRQMYDTAKSYNMSMTIYNNPFCTPNTINKSVLRKLPEIYLKDSTRESDLMLATDKYFCGEDRRISSSYEDGAIGFISGAANADPELYIKLEKALDDGDSVEVGKLQERVNDQLYSLAEGGVVTHKKLKMSISNYLPGYPAGARSPY